MTALAFNPFGTSGTPSPPEFCRCAMNRPCTLKQAVESAICALEDDILAPVVSMDAGSLPLTRAVLALLAVCYACQVYGSDDVVDVAKWDPDFRRLKGAEFPGASVIRRFRTANGLAVHRCLVAALRFLAQQKIASGTLAKVSDAQLAREASRRITMAAFTDCMEFEEGIMDGPPARSSSGVARHPG